MLYNKCNFSYAGRFNSRGAWIHPYALITTWEIIYVLSGEVYIEENGIQYTLLPGQIILLTPGVPHQGYKSSTQVDFFWMHFTVEKGASLPEPLVDLHDMVLEDAYYIDILSKQLLHYATSNQYPEEACNYLIRLILLEIARQRPDKREDCHHEAFSMEKWIAANILNSITVHEVAEHFGYSDDHAERLYKKAFYISMKKDINDRKMRQIKSTLLTSNTPLEKISVHFGFDNYKQFLKYFRYHESISPTTFRKLYYQMYLNTNQ